MERKYILLQCNSAKTIMPILLPGLYLTKYPVWELLRTDGAVYHVICALTFMRRFSREASAYYTNS